MKITVRAVWHPSKAWRMQWHIAVKRDCQTEYIPLKQSWAWENNELSRGLANGVATTLRVKLKNEGAGNAIREMIRFDDLYRDIECVRKTDRKSARSPLNTNNIRDYPDCGGIYFLQTLPPDGPIKIGLAYNIQRRTLGLQTSHPWPLKLLGYEKIEDRCARFVREKELHVKFAPYRLHGEWFQIPPEVCLCYAKRLEDAPPLTSTKTEPTPSSGLPPP